MTRLGGVLRRVSARALPTVGRADVDSTSVVLLGDSITEAGDWSSLLSGRNVANYGYSGYTTAEFVPVARKIARRGPAAVFVMSGTNDIRDGHPPAWTVTELGRILDSFEARSPSTRVVVQTVLPRADAAIAVAATNAAITEFVEIRNATLLDLYSEFHAGNGGLYPEETTDGIHLDVDGYRRWAVRLDVALRSWLD